MWFLYIWHKRRETGASFEREYHPSMEGAILFSEYHDQCQEWLKICDSHHYTHAATLIGKMKGYGVVCTTLMYVLAWSTAEDRTEDDPPVGLLSPT
jgi:hypothetical protein